MKTSLLAAVLLLLANVSVAEESSMRKGLQEMLESRNALIDRRVERKICELIE